MANEIITSKNNDIVKFLVSLSDKNVRLKSGCYLTEGKRSVFESFDEKVATQIVVSQNFTKSKRRKFKFIKEKYEIHKCKVYKKR